MPKIERRYESGEDAAMRLDRTVCRYNNDYVYLIQYDGLGFKSFRLSDSKEEIVNANDPNLDVAAFPIGYLNRDGFAFFLSRDSLRKQKQGLCADVAYMTQDCATSLDVLDWSPTDKKWWKPMDESFRGKFPSLKKCLEEVRSSRAMAFSRKYAVAKLPTGSKVLRYCGLTIGAFVDGHCVLDTPYQDSIYQRHLYSLMEGNNGL